jgi:hypothetical protein
LAKQFQFAFVPHQQGAQHHHAAFLGEQSRRHRDAVRVQDKPREPLERKNVQARIAWRSAIGEQLAFELKRGLFGREQDQRRAFLFPFGNSYYYSFPIGKSRLVDKTIKFENLCH